MAETKRSKPDAKPHAKILVIEDDRGISSTLGQVLMGEGYQVTVAGDGAVVSELLSHHDFDLVLLDLHVPNRHGFDILKEIRQRDADSGGYLPVIVLTGVYTTSNDKAASLNAGADDFLSKPFELLELLARVRSHLRVQDLYRRAQFLATHDPLTRCYNRRYFVDFLAREFERMKRHNAPVSVLMLDLDSFKKINDQFGHDGGDAVLRHVGFRLQDFFRATDCVARLGGDEFAAILPDTRAADAQQAVERLVRFMDEPATRKGLAPELASRVSFSVGIACAPEHTESPQPLLKLADCAMYEAKKLGRNRFIVWGQGRMAA